MTTELHAAAPAIVLLVDESAAMQEAVRDGKKSRSAAVATAINSLLKQLAVEAPCSVAVLGYTIEDETKAIIGSRWAGELAGRLLVETDSYRNVPVVVEQRTRRIPDSSGFGVEREETIEFPVWYQSRDAETPIAQWNADVPSDKRTLIVHITSGGEYARLAAEAIYSGTSRVASYAHVEIGSSSGAPAICFPANSDYLPLRDAAWFERTSMLSRASIEALRSRGLSVNAGARALVFQGGLKELLDAFAAVRAWAVNAEWTTETSAEPAAGSEPAAKVSEEVTPPAEPEVALEQPLVEPTPSAFGIHIEESTLRKHAPEPLLSASSTSSSELAIPVRRGLIMLVLDRSLQDPVAPPTNDAFTRLKQQANDILAEITRTADGWLDVGLVTYGRKSSGAVEISTRFFGGLADHSIATDRQLAASAIRTETYDQHLPNGIGGIIAVQRKRPIYIELPPTEQVSCVEAFQAVAPLLGGWCSRNRGECAAPLIIHMTRGAISQRDLRAGLKKLKDLRSPAVPPLVHHVVITETPGPAIAFPTDCQATGPAELRFFCELSSSHVSAAFLAAKHRQLQPDSRGIVVNGTFDLAVAGYRHSLCNPVV